MTQSVKFSVLRFSRLPAYFDENELRSYLKQFGNVEGVHMPKSKKTLKTKGYAFVKVAKEIAPIIASTVDGVLNFNKIMKCELVEDPKWKAFRRKPVYKTTRQVESQRQLEASVTRSTKARAAATKIDETNKSTSKSAPVNNRIVRRRLRSFEKRIAEIKKTNPTFSLCS